MAETDLFDGNLGQSANPPQVTDPTSGAGSGIISGRPLGKFNIRIPKPFVLAEQDQGSLDKIQEEVMDKVHQWENRMIGFFNEYEEYCDSWRNIPRRVNKKPYGLFSSKSGETHRATETLATAWFRMLTAQDPFYEAIAEGFDQFGQQLTSQDLYAVEAVLRKQLQKTHFKEKLLRGMNSLALFGTVIFEEPFIELPYGNGTKTFEATDIVQRSLLTTGFDPFTFDLDMSDYIFTIDFPTLFRLRNMASANEDTWDKAKIEQIISDNKNVNKGGPKSTTIYSRVLQRRSRAGYNLTEDKVFELETYHGRIDTENPVVQAYWESKGFQDDPKFCDFTIGSMDGDGIVRFHNTAFKTWHSVFKTAHYKLFEMEGLGYGVGKLGRKLQRELDVTQSRTNDILMFALLSMWKVGRFAGLKANQLAIKPWQIVELEDISQLEPIRPPIEAIANAVNMMAGMKEEFRNTVGAQSNLQAELTKASATESSIAQNEGIRGVSVHAEIIAETFLREHLETMHLNNLSLMENEIWVNMAGSPMPRMYNRDNLPISVGFNIKTTTDKDFRPERLANILQALQMATSIRNVVPDTMNIIKPLFEEWFRGLGMNPRLLDAPVPIYQQMSGLLQRAQRMQQMGSMPPSVQAEMGGEAAGSGANVSTPIGQVPTSPLASGPVQMSA